MATDLDVIDDGQVVEKSNVLKSAGDSQCGDGLRLPAANGHGLVIAAKNDAAFGWLLDTGHTIEKSCFTGAVGSNQSDDGPLFNGKIDISERL